MRGDAWFSLGCCALRVEEWREAVQAFRRKLDLGGDDFQSWNNLGHAYIKLGQNDRAFYALKESTKYEYENWKVWDNIVGVSIEVGEFSDCLSAIGRVLDLRKKFNDFRVLAILIESVRCYSPYQPTLPSNQLQYRSSRYGALRSISQPSLATNCNIDRVGTVLFALSANPP
jgi:tetratricopeptide (TPR) repeat protein